MDARNAMDLWSDLDRCMTQLTTTIGRAAGPSDVVGAASDVQNSIRAFTELGRHVKKELEDSHVKAENLRRENARLMSELQQAVRCPILHGTAATPAATHSSEDSDRKVHDNIAAQGNGGAREGVPVKLERAKACHDSICHVRRDVGSRVNIEPPEEDHDSMAVETNVKTEVEMEVMESKRLAGSLKDDVQVNGSTPQENLAANDGSMGHNRAGTSKKAEAALKRKRAKQEKRRRDCEEKAQENAVKMEQSVKSTSIPLHDGEQAENAAQRSKSNRNPPPVQVVKKLRKAFQIAEKRWKTGLKTEEERVFMMLYVMEALNTWLLTRVGFLLEEGFLGGCRQLEFDAEVQFQEIEDASEVILMEAAKVFGSFELVEVSKAIVEEFTEAFGDIAIADEQVHVPLNGPSDMERIAAQLQSLRASPQMYFRTSYVTARQKLETFMELLSGYTKGLDVKGELEKLCREWKEECEGWKDDFNMQNFQGSEGSTTLISGEMQGSSSSGEAFTTAGLERTRFDTFKAAVGSQQNLYDYMLFAMEASRHVTRDMVLLQKMADDLM